MSCGLENKVAIVTGASRGIGRAIAVTLSKHGASVVLAARSERGLKETAEAIKGSAGRTVIVPTDMTDEASIRNLVKVTQDSFGRLDILVNNAGVTHSCALEKTRTEDWDRCQAVNARGPFILCREALPLMKRSGGGRIVNISSVVGVKGYRDQSAYTASKHALRGMSIALADEVKNDNIRVHVVCPGGVDTDLIGDVRPDIPKGDLMRPEEIAELVLYLVSHKGNAVVDELHIRRAASAPWF